MARRKKTDEDKPEENTGNVNDSDETFGLPEIEYEPLNRDKPSESEPEASEVREEARYQSEGAQEPEAQPSQYTYMYNEEEKPSNGPRILLVIIILLAVAGAGWYFLYYKPKQDEQAKIDAQELAERQAIERREQARRDSLALIAAREQYIADSLANLQSQAGSIQVLSDRTGLWHVVIASAIDDDLLMDYATKLSARGVSCKIIPPFGSTQFFRLTIADGDTYTSTQSIADGLKDEYGDAVWVVKY